MTAASNLRACFATAAICICSGFMLSAGAIAILMTIIREHFLEYHHWLAAVIVIGSGFGVLLLGMVLCGYVVCRKMSGGGDVAPGDDEGGGEEDDTGGKNNAKNPPYKHSKISIISEKTKEMSSMSSLKNDSQGSKQSLVKQSSVGSKTSLKAGSQDSLLPGQLPNENDKS